LRDQARAERKEKYTQILKLKEKLERLAEKKPPRNMRDVESEIERLEWKIQTTSLPVHEEKLLIDQVRVLETQRAIHRQIQNLNDALFELQTEEKALETRANLHHEKLSELAEQSQSFHEKMTELLDKVDVLRVEADAAHQKYVEIKQQAQTVHQEQTELLRQFKSLRQELRHAEEKKQAKRQRELRKDLVEKASEKLKRGEKLTWEEFKILAEKKKV
jgi:phosphoserine phosphatase